MSGRIATTHTGSLPRAPRLREALIAREAGVPVDDARLREQIDRAVVDIVRQQREAGVDVVNDGEQGKISYSTYVKDRLAGFEGESRPPTGGASRDMAEHPDWAVRWQEMIGRAALKRPTCNGPISLRDPDAVRRDIAALQAAAPAGDGGLFLSAASPGVIAVFFANDYYPTHEAYVTAIAEAMRDEYRAIADSGITLQLDCPDLAMSRHGLFAGKTVEEFQRALRVNVGALNHALEAIPPERVRMHVCWGNYAGPHTYDVPLREIVEILFEANVAGLSFEAANPRHAHEFAVFDDVKLPEGRYLIPGVVDSTTNYVEHPDLVAQRLVAYASRVGGENVMAGSDCGFATSASMDMVVPSVVWTKLRAMAEGAELASRAIWR
jgi:5-methyltetrahydropteroyltriglutamate--homocysteine methyltransferase